MRRMYLFFVTMIGLLFVGCQKEIEVDIPDYQDKIVIEGSIENGQPAMVIVSNSVPYFSTIDLDMLLNEVFIKDAVVTVTSSTGETEQLTFAYTEESPIYFAYMGQNIIGEPGKSYALRVEYGGKVYTSQTSIVQPVALDSVWLAFIDENDTMPTSRILLSDNAETQDYYQFRIKIHGKDLTDRLWVTSMPVAFDDATFNGKTVNYEILRANPSTLFMPTTTDEEESDFYRITYRPGDTIYIKTSMLDYPAYRFWSTISNELSFGQNPFMSPAPIISNINGDNAMGVWCGYASTIDTLYYQTRQRGGRKR
ncbi:MAG TPA: DUF4249 domain-containing protein [Bacteroidales bacterium]|nr:DUF4249 domain-containing protein [Bacteroidales bacterium]HNW68670.1 DUF4249 domain-containing protein [Bacteroidales bacterium]HPT53164.1 DUF4249 domain-containing protein [Bacteroidales bacterium]